MIKKNKGRTEVKAVASAAVEAIESELAEKKPVSKTVQSKSFEGISQALDAIRTKFGDEAIMKLGEKPRVNVGAIPTGSLGLDWALGIGGFPRGRIVEIFGPESSGKTTLALHAVAEAQKLGGICAYIDAEHAMDPEYAKRLGVKIDDLLISQPDTGEQALEIVESHSHGQDGCGLVIDSVAALTPRAEIEGDMGAHHWYSSSSHVSGFA
jgi:recombination protein RecA